MRRHQRVGLERARVVQNLRPGAVADHDGHRLERPGEPARLVGSVHHERDARAVRPELARQEVRGTPGPPRAGSSWPVLPGRPHAAQEGLDGERHGRDGADPQIPVGPFPLREEDAGHHRFTPNISRATRATMRLRVSESVAAKTTSASDSPACLRTPISAASPMTVKPLYSPERAPKASSSRSTMTTSAPWPLRRLPASGPTPSAPDDHHAHARLAGSCPEAPPA
ncbi:MAG: hypothetical protein MZV70_08170 [Desulfobacterales bacterium]|nr:hypothetical protein [Desulfobacterales bacterium]